MKGFELTDAIKREVEKKGTAGSVVKGIDDNGEVYDILEVEDEPQPDGDHILWLKLSWANS